MSIEKINIRKYFPLILRGICWFIFLIYLIGIPSTINIDYFHRPELIGVNYLPVDLFSKEMVYIYEELIIVAIFSISAFGVLLKKKWGWILINVIYVIDFLVYIFNLFLYRINKVYITDWPFFLMELFLSMLIVFLVNTKEVKAKFNIKLPSLIDFSF
ncbi:MAG: hypothetical protein CMO01_13160 [Thalassobius sp.]|nr:hypothetical protein [Thalassovita sp.]